MPRGCAMRSGSPSIRRRASSSPWSTSATAWATSCRPITSPTSSRAASTAGPQPGYGEKRPDLVAKTIVPDLLFRTHSAPLGPVFYTGTQFPEAFRGDAYVALHGSWNAARPRGYEVVRVPFKDGRPVGSYENFATGFWFAGAARAEVWGRPVGLAIAKDGSIFVTDDGSRSVWHVTYIGK